MQKILLPIIAFLLLLSCNDRKVAEAEIKNLTQVQLENNKIAIEKIRQELEELEIDKLAPNISLMKNLEQTHAQLLALQDSLELLGKNEMVARTERFIQKNFYHLDAFNDVPMEINPESASALITLRMSVLEGFLIRQSRSEYFFGNEVRFNKMSPQILPSKSVFKKGETITGSVIMIAESSFEQSKGLVRQIMMNGQEVSAGKDGWKFEIKARNSGTLELHCRVVIGDTTKLFATREVFIQD